MRRGAALVVAVHLPAALSPLTARAASGAHQAARLAALVVAVFALRRPAVPFEPLRALSLLTVDGPGAHRPAAALAGLGADDAALSAGSPGALVAGGRVRRAGRHVRGHASVIVAVDAARPAGAPAPAFALPHAVEAALAAGRLVPSSALDVAVAAAAVAALIGQALGAALVPAVDLLEDAAAPAAATALLGPHEATFGAPAQGAGGALLLAGVRVSVQAGGLFASDLTSAGAEHAPLADPPAADAALLACLTVAVGALLGRGGALSGELRGAALGVAVDAAGAGCPRAVFADLRAPLAAVLAISARALFAIHGLIRPAALVGVGGGAALVSAVHRANAACAPRAVHASPLASGALVAAAFDVARLTLPLGALIGVPLGAARLAAVDPLQLAATPVTLDATLHAHQATVAAGPDVALVAGRAFGLLAVAGCVGDLSAGVGESRCALGVLAVDLAVAESPLSVLAQLMSDDAGDGAASGVSVDARQGALAFALAFSAHLAFAFAFARIVLAFALALAFARVGLALAPFVRSAFAFAFTLALALASGDLAGAVRGRVAARVVGASRDGQREEDTEGEGQGGQAHSGWLRAPRDTRDRE